MCIWIIKIKDKNKNQYKIILIYQRYLIIHQSIQGLNNNQKIMKSKYNKILLMDVIRRIKLWWKKEESIKFKNR